MSFTKTATLEDSTDDSKGTGGGLPGERFDLFFLDEKGYLWIGSNTMDWGCMSRNGMGRTRPETDALFNGEVMVWRTMR